jgi:hypothetical protein
MQQSCVCYLKGVGMLGHILLDLILLHRLGLGSRLGDLSDLGWVLLLLLLRQLLLGLDLFVDCRHGFDFFSDFRGGEKGKIFFFRVVKGNVIACTFRVWLVVADVVVVCVCVSLFVFVVEKRGARVNMVFIYFPGTIDDSPRFSVLSTFTSPCIKKKSIESH